MALALDANGKNGIAFLVSAGIVYEILAFACSSPQTAEINIQTRGDTLMKWVHLGQALAAAFIIAAAKWDSEHRTPILVGGIFAMATGEAFYLYAKRSGLSKPGPMTEQHYGAQKGFRWG